MTAWREISQISAKKFQKIHKLSYKISTALNLTQIYAKIHKIQQENSKKFTKFNPSKSPLMAMKRRRIQPVERALQETQPVQPR